MADNNASSGADVEEKRVMSWSSRQVVYESISRMIPAWAARWVRPNLINSFSVQFVINAPKAQPVTSKLLGQRLNFAFEPGDYASSLPDSRADRKAHV